MSDLISRLKSWHHLAQGDGLEALIVTGIEAADRITALEAQVAAADRLAEVVGVLGLRNLVAGWNGEHLAEPYKPHDQRLGVTLKTTCGAVYAIDTAITAYLATKEPKA